MKDFIHKIQGLGQKAQQISDAIQAAPAKVAAYRESALKTVEHIRQTRAEVQSGLVTLQTNNEERLVQAIQEIDRNAAVFEEVGYLLADVEMEASQPQRLVVHLEKLEEIPSSVLEALAGKHPPGSTTRVLLSALVSAKSIADSVATSNMEYHKLIVYVGITSAFRLCWRAGTRSVESVAPSAPVAMPSQITSPETARPEFSSIFGEGSFFGKSTTAPVQAVSLPVASSTLEPSVPLEAPKSIAAESSVPVMPPPSDPLARFKKMPDLSKR